MNNIKGIGIWPNTKEKSNSFFIHLVISIDSASLIDTSDELINLYNSITFMQFYNYIYSINFT